MRFRLVAADQPGGPGRPGLHRAGVPSSGRPGGRRREGRAGRRGQATVEMALVLPILLLLLLGVAEFGRMTHAYLTVIHAAREGLRVGVTGAGDSTVESRIRAQAAGLDPSRLEIDISPAASPRTPGSDLTVAVSYPVDLMTPLVSQVLGGSVTVSVELTSRVE